MSIPGAGSPLFLSAAAAEAAAFQVNRSLRFSTGDSADLSKTFSSAGNRKTWTWSCWYKRTVLGTKNQRFFSCLTGSNDNTYLELRSFDNDTICLSGYATNFRVTDAEIRDPSAWYHLVVACDTTQSSNSDRVKLYINGVQQTFRTEATITQNADLGFNQAAAHKIGNAFDGYLAEIHFVDGTQLAPTDFGEYDDNNNWNPKDCQSSLTYGTNGFYLKFADNSSASNLGTDSSGNSNTWTVNNLSVASGSGNDSLIDTPTNYTADSGNNGGNYATLNPLQAGSQCTLSNGNLDLVWSGTSGHAAGSTIAVSSGKWYVEFTVGAKRGMIGIIPSTYTSALNIWPGNSAYGSDSYGYYGIGGNLYNNSSNSAYGAGWTTNDVIGIALDLDAGNLVFYKNGSSQGTAATGLSGSYIFAIGFSDFSSGGAPGSFNFGQRPFAYTPPTDHLSLCTTNLPDPTIADGSTAMDVVTYSGDGTNGRDITGLGFSPDLVWIKARNQDDGHNLFDSVRGTTKVIKSNNMNAELTESNSLTAFNSDGFTVGSNASNAQVNQSGFTYVGWAWDAGTSTVSNTDGSITSNVRANASAGISIVTFTGDGSGNDTIGHGLNTAPEFYLLKDRDNSTDWLAYTTVIDGTLDYMYLNTTAGKSNSAYTAPTSSVFSYGTDAADYVCYLFNSVKGFSKIGTYVGNNSTNGPFVYTGFRPAWVMVKSINSAAYFSWVIVDSARSTYNPTDHGLFPNSSENENDLPGYGARDFYIDLLSNGFKIRIDPQSINTDGQTYFYAAFAEHPFKTARAR